MTLWKYIKKNFITNFLGVLVCIIVLAVMATPTTLGILLSPWWLLGNFITIPLAITLSDYLKAEESNVF